jgi:hypothetical protein
LDISSPPSYGSVTDASVERTTRNTAEVSSWHSEDQTGLRNDNNKKFEPGAVPLEQHRHRQNVFFRQATSQISDVRKQRQQQLIKDAHGLVKPFKWFGQKLKSLRFHLSLSGIRVDFQNFEKLPRGSPQWTDAGRDNVTCTEHNGNECYCIWLYYKEHRVCMNWKPFALGKYEAMMQGLECEVHKSYRCYCLWRPSENKASSIYDLKYLERPIIR